MNATDNNKVVDRAAELLAKLPQERQAEALRYIRLLGSSSFMPPQHAGGIDELFGAIDNETAEQMKRDIAELCEIVEKDL
jgi:hypothetical protein